MLAFVVGRARTARADGTSATAVPVAVLAFDSEQAEEQADALTSAMKARIRATHGYTLVETNQSLGMLTAALRCPSRPTPECQQKIAEQIKQERYVWGVVTPAGAGQVNAEVHLYQRGKPDAVVQERYADNLKDGNDDALRKIAQRIIDRLSGSALAVLVVKAGNVDGEVVVDGDKRFPLKNGSARIELSPDSHAVEVAAPGVPASKRNVLLAVGKETVVDLTPSPQTGGPPAAEEPKSAFPTRKVIGGALLVVGVGAEIFAFERYSKWKSLKDEVNDPKLTDGLITNGQKVPACDAQAPPGGGTTEQVCKKSDEANTVGITGIVAGSVGGLLLLGGAYLVIFGNDEKEGTKTAKVRATRVSPWVGQGTAGASLGGTF